MKPSHFWLFSLAFAAGFIGAALLGFPSAFYPLMKAGDALDLLTPLVLIPLYWSLFVGAAVDKSTVPESAWFVLLAALWLLGHGMHLAANSIGPQLSELQASPAKRLTTFYDEGLSHYLWHLGLFALTALIMIRSWRAGGSMRAERRSSLLAASILYGLTYFIVVVEGGNWPIGLPFALLGGVLLLLLRARDLRKLAVLDYFTWAHLVALVLFVAWVAALGGSTGIQ